MAIRLKSINPRGCQSDAILTGCERSSRVREHGYFGLRAYISIFLSTLEVGARDLLLPRYERNYFTFLRHAILRHNMKIQFTSQIFHEGKMYVAYTPELDVSSGATTEAKAQKNLFEAVRLFLEEAEKKVRWIRFSRRRGLFVANRLSLRRGR